MIFTTGIGSIPITSFQQAAEYVCEHYTLPFLPETLDTRTRLPAMLSHLLTSDEIAALERGDWEAFSAFINEHPQEFSQIYDLPVWESATSNRRRKAQIVGPTTLVAILANFFPNQPGPDIEELALPFHRDRFTNLMQAIGSNSEATYITFDEPLMADRTMAAVHANLRPLKSLTTNHPNVKLGIHCCAPIRLDLFAQEFSDLGLAFDMNQLSPHEAPAARKIMQSDWVIFGTVDTSQSPLNVEKALERAKQMQADWLAPDYAGDTVISGGCGTGSRTFFYEKAVANCLQASTKLLQSEHS